MNESAFRLAVAPIVEAILDVECDMPPTRETATLEGAVRDAFQDRYPKFKTQWVDEHQFEAQIDSAPRITSRRAIQAFQLLHDDERQLVQVRAQGFSFNRLAPYTSLDDYLPEMERTWKLFVEVAAPAQIRLIRLRYINRILLPTNEGRDALDQYLTCGPRLPDQEKLALAGFLHQHTAVEVETGNQVNILLAAQQPEHGTLPIIFDVAASRAGNVEPTDWTALCSTILSLRRLKNFVFKNSLTNQCLSLFQP